MKVLAATSGSTRPMHIINIDHFDPVTLEDIGQPGSYEFDSWAACEAWLRARGYTDEAMFSDDWSINKTGVYIEHIPSPNAETDDPTWIAELEAANRKYGPQPDASDDCVDLCRELSKLEKTCSYLHAHYFADNPEAGKHFEACLKSIDKAIEEAQSALSAITR